MAVLSQPLAQRAVSRLLEIAPAVLNITHTNPLTCNLEQLLRGIYVIAQPDEVSAAIERATGIRVPPTTLLRWRDNLNERETL